MRSLCFLIITTASAFTVPTPGTRPSLGAPAHIRTLRDAAPELKLRGGYAPPQMASLPPIATSAAVFGVANAVGLGISAVFNGCHLHLDLIGTGAFAVAAWALRGTTLAQQASAGAVAAWAVKLASFLFFRACITKKDLRLDESLSTFSGQFGFWLISFLWGWLVSLPHTLATGVPLAERPPFGRVHIAGLALFATGFALETAADLSKWVFKASEANAGKFCDVGVWNLCQHPNWFGNLLIWTGILVLNSPTLLSGAAAGSGGAAVRILGGRFTFPAAFGALCRFGLAAVCPAFLLLLFSGQANGVPPLNKGFDMMMAKHGGAKAFQEYDAITPRLIPTLGSVARWLRGT